MKTHGSLGNIANEDADLESGEIMTASGGRLWVRTDTMCVHGDTHGAVEMALAIEIRLVAAGISIRPLADWLF